MVREGHIAYYKDRELCDIAYYGVDSDHRSGLISAFILAFINSFNDVSIGVFISSPGTMTLPTAMQSLIIGRLDPTIAAASVLLMLMTILLMTLSEKLLGIKLRR